MKKHWIVISQRRGPSDWPCQHNTLQSAENEARRLASNHPGDEFLVFQSISVSRKQDVVTLPLTEEEYPF